MNENQKIALEMLDQIERARSGAIPSDQLEEKLWRLLDATSRSFPVTLAGQVDELVQGLRRLRTANRAFAQASEVDEDHGAEVLYNEVSNALSRFLG